jgi:hypothetical protein
MSYFLETLTYASGIDEPGKRCPHGSFTGYHIWYHTYMVKTTVYLPESLKRRLQRLAKRLGRSEAQLIRDAVERAVQEQQIPPPTLPLFASNDPRLAERVDEALAGFGE